VEKEGMNKTVVFKSILWLCLGIIFILPVFLIIMNAFKPIIGDVERYKATRNDIGFLTELKDMGAHIQVNADTISGQDGFGAKTFARKVMKHGLLDFVGSDGHRKTERIPEIGKCVAKMEKTMGSEYVKKIFIKNPRKITG